MINSYLKIGTINKKRNGLITKIVWVIIINIRLKIIISLIYIAKINRNWSIENDKRKCCEWNIILEIIIKINILIINRIELNIREKALISAKIIKNSILKSHESIIIANK